MQIVRALLETLRDRNDSLVSHLHGLRNCGREFHTLRRSGEGSRCFRTCILRGFQLQVPVPRHGFLGVRQAVRRGAHSSAANGTHVAERIPDLRHNLAQFVQKGHTVSSCAEASQDSCCLQGSVPCVQSATLTRTSLMPLLHPSRVCHETRLHRLVRQKFNDNFQLPLDETICVVDRRVDDSNTMGSNGPSQMLNGDHPHLTSTLVGGLGEQLLVKTVPKLCCKDIDVPHDFDDVEAVI
mmetsp:Transcript_65955/g.174855  ORF Transcript_65955/g.174855 Transcript_65955/m.174855 type:complete len:239 (+) Transcript_65955:642-1358(+)